MDSKTKAGIISVILAVIGLGAGGAVYNLDFSTNTDNSSTNISGDTIIGNILDNEVIRDIGEDVALDIVCAGEPIPSSYVELCKGWTP